MARVSFPIHVVAIFLLCTSALQSAFSTTGLLSPPHHGARPPMVLPLFLSPPNSSRASTDSRRRHLQGSEKPNARMSLHDDLLLNGYYTTRLWIGTPPQKFALIVDTGSTVTYVPCSNCDQCGKHQDPKFQPKESSTYHPVKCNIDCNCDENRVQCVYERQYAEMSSSSGVLGEDLVSFGNLSGFPPQQAVFGCENMETGDLYSQHADGIMGLGRGDLSIVDQLVGKGVISDSFSLCYGGMEIGGGAMVLGAISPPSDMVFSYSDPVRSPYYNIDLKELHVGGKPLSLSQNIFDKKYGSVLDSGTTYGYLPEEAFLAFKEAIMKEVQSLKKIRGPDPSYNDICFSGAGSDISQLSSSFPAVDMIFGNGHKLTLSPENYLFRHSKVQGAYCLGIFQNGKDPTTLLGGIIVRNTLVTYDREHSKIGFWKTNCSELWDRLHLSSPSHALPPVSNTTTNQTNHLAPTLAPTFAPMPPHIDNPETPVGQITFDMFTSMNISELKPRTVELAEFIAHELDVNITQVHLLGVTAKVNGSLLKWAILPVSGGESISNSSAMEIISRFSEHRVQLPETFGSCQLTQWHVEPLETRTWRQKHYQLLVMAIVITLLVGLSASGVWLLWRRKKQNLNAYKPVGMIVPEQELQAL
ncbi:hypothetical protein SAY86_031377 [Trapa natans]|uniref:Peptidase A1 domain-containing protein n=1 Tax=Trapa natans TaxID=22666 RepID=A0AAN7LU00_TRANT|nr:hypothetical protein SAY86_031377 [Trapa natans]